MEGMGPHGTCCQYGLADPCTAASAYYSLASTFGDLASFNGGSPMGEQVRAGATELLF